MSNGTIVVRGGNDAATVGSALLGRTSRIEDAGMPLGLVSWRGLPWRWKDGKWVGIKRSEFLDELWLTLGNVMIETGEGDDVRRKKWGVTASKVSDVARWIEARVAKRGDAAPVDLRGEVRWPVGKTITFRDVVLNCVTGETMARGAWWFDPCTLPVDWGDGEVRCPEWMGCMERWSKGDPEWVECMRRVMGYALMGWRGLQKLVLMYGVPRAGKSLTMGVLRRLLGEDLVVARGLDQMAGTHGMMGTEGARIISVGEVTKIKGQVQSQACGLIKSIVGEDPIAINPKNLAIEQVRSNALMMLLSNEIPEFPESSASLTCKMVVLPFEVSFVGKEDDDLGERLGAEVEGIARWAARGAMRIFSEKEPSLRLVSPGSSKQVMEIMKEMGNPLQAWILRMFEPAANNWVNNETIRRLWERSGPKVRGTYSGNLLGAVMESIPKEWAVWTKSSNGHRRVQGMQLRAGVREEVLSDHG